MVVVVVVDLLLGPWGTSQMLWLLLLLLMLLLLLLLLLLIWCVPPFGLNRLDSDGIVSFLFRITPPAHPPPQPEKFDMIATRGSNKDIPNRM